MRSPCQLTQAALPATIRAHAFSPRLVGVISTLTGTSHGSKRDAQAIVETIFGVPVAVGTIGAAERETSAALAEAHAEAQRACQAAPAHHVDETSWKLGKQLLWLWTAVSNGCTFFLIHRKRGAEALAAVFHQAFAGITSSDRWVV